MKNFTYVKFVYHKNLYKNEIPCQAVCNKMAMKMCLYKDFLKLEKSLISERTLYKKIAIMHGKDEFSKI